MGWIPGCPQDAVTPKGSLVPRAVVLHRTYGFWPGDYAVIRRGGTCQVLIGKEPGQWVQFMRTDQVAYHCNGGNFQSFGVELTGVNEEPLTDWQAARLGDVLRYANAEHGIPIAYTGPDVVPPASVWVNGGNFAGIISHVSVKTDNGSAQHTDEVSGLDVLHALGVEGEEDMTPAEHDILLATNNVANILGQQMHDVVVPTLADIVARLEALENQPGGEGGGAGPLNVTLTGTATPA